MTLTSVILFGGCCLVRLVFLLLSLEVHRSYGNFIYWEIATNLLRHGTLGLGGVPTTFYEPAYPFFLAAVRAVSADGLFWAMSGQVFLSAVGAVLFFKLCSHLAGDNRVAAAAAAFYVLYPYYVWQSISVIEVTYYTVSLILMAYTFVRVKDAASAIVCAAALANMLLTRMTSVPVFLAAVAMLLAGKRRLGLVVVVTACLLVAPYLARNYRIDGSILPSRTGQNLFISNNEYTDRLMPDYSLDLSYYEYMRSHGASFAGLNDRQKDDRFKNEALDFIRRHPARALKTRLMNIVYLFDPRIVPRYSFGDARIAVSGDGTFSVIGAVRRPPAMDLAHSLSYGFLFVTAIAGMYLRRKLWRQDLILYTVFLGFIPVYSYYWAATRLRAPLDFIWMFFSAAAVIFVYDRIRGRTS